MVHKYLIFFVIKFFSFNSHLTIVATPNYFKLSNTQFDGNKNIKKNQNMAAYSRNGAHALLLILNCSNL